jgi:broad specificity phosphatase PhoE
MYQGLHRLPHNEAVNADALKVDTELNAALRRQLNAIFNANAERRLRQALCFKGQSVEIVLFRHGKPNIDTSGRVSAADFGKWVSDYDMTGIDEEHKPVSSTIQRAEQCAFTACSNLPRSVKSARISNIEAPEIVSPLFRECEIPYSNWKFPRLSKTSWSVLFRLLQLSGYSSIAESYREVKKRSKECAAQLIELSQIHDSVLFLGRDPIRSRMPRSASGCSTTNRIFYRS